MAEAFFARHAPPDVRAESAGQEPAREVWPQVVEAMAEVGIDLRDRRPQKLTVRCSSKPTGRSRWPAGRSAPTCRPRSRWDIPDPAGRSLEGVRAIRDAIEARVRELLDEKIGLIRSDRTAHQARLWRLLPGLIEEFGGQRTEEEIRTAADAALAELRDAPVRSFVMTIANRKAREVLRSSSQPAPV